MAFRDGRDDVTAFAGAMLLSDLLALARAFLKG